MQTPVEIEVEETDQILQQVAAIDVATATGMVGTRLPHQTVADRRLTKGWQVKATTRAILEQPRPPGLSGHPAGGAGVDFR